MSTLYNSGRTPQEYEHRIAELLNKCDRLAAENKRLREALEKFDALIQYQYSGSREAMSALQEVADIARAALKEKS